MKKLHTLLLAAATVAAAAAASAAQGGSGKIGAVDRRFCLSDRGGSIVSCAQGAVYTRVDMRTSSAGRRNAFVFFHDHYQAGRVCLDGRGGKGQPAMLARCDGTRAQDWWISRTGQLQNQANNLCMDVEGARYAHRARVLMWDCHSEPNQRWFIFVPD